MSEKTSEHKFICIMCPLGCEVTVRSDDKENIIEIMGNKCAKGETYAKDEFTKPMRVLTSTVKIDGALFPRLPVRTSDLIPKDKIFDCMKEIQKIKIKCPLKNGDIVIRNMLGLNVDVIATRDL